MPLKFWMDISTKDLMLIIVLIEKRFHISCLSFVKKMKLVDMLGIFGGRSDMVDNNYIGVPLQL